MWHWCLDTDLRTMTLSFSMDSHISHAMPLAVRDVKIALKTSASKAMAVVGENAHPMNEQFEREERERERRA